MPTLVALDIETTGLDHQKDAVLEIGAVRFNERRVEGEWSTFVNPGRSIPPFITQLTGITNEMVSNAPPLRNVLGDLVKFIGDAPVVGHNVSFDLSFLRKNKVLGLNEAMDTYEMASILLPGAGRYNLGALAQALGIPYPHDNIHRALTDAKLTRSVFLRLYEIALHLPIDLLAEIVRISEPLEWGGYWAFRSVLQTRSRETVRGRPTAQAYAGPLFDQRPVRIPNFLQPKDTLCPLDVDEVSSVLEPGGAFSRHFPNFEYRLEQVAMLRAVAEALTNGRHLMVEAGTGVGKSVAYLIPAVTWAVQNNIRVVISTNTINLQDQLINKDIPDVRAALGIDFQAAVLKGRANYLCPRRLDNLRRRGPESSEEMRVLAKILVWLQSSSSGDRAEINLNGPVEREVWMRISAEDEGCTSDSCMQRTGGTCPFHRARLASQSAHILIVNHALLLADVATGNRVLPEYDYLIVDEAHHLEEATTSSLSFRVNQFEIDGLIRLLGGPSAGTLSWALKAMEPLLAPADLAAYTHLVHRAADLAFQLDHLARGFFATIEQFLVEQREGRTLGPYAHQERILPATRTQPAWGEVEMAWDEAEQALQPLLDTLAKIAQGVAELMDGMQEEGQDLFGQLSTIYRRFSEVYEHLHALVFEPDQERVYWAEVQSDGRRLSLHAAPLHIGPLMQRFLWHEKSSVILTSATLTAAGEFDYLRSRLYADDAYELALGSPFDYESAVLVYIPEDIPEPNERYNYQKAVDRSLIQLCQATGGRALVLFTSYAQLRNTAQSIGPVLADRGILVYEQGEGASPHALLETFRSADKAVLLGTRAFWEGVDVPGEALSVLVIVKLPFDVPTDPIVAARSETFEDSFNQYSLPEAILRFRQGFGRLIRTQSDRGVVALLDRRVLTKRYGKVFIDSLPGCTVRVGLLANLPREATRWLNL